ncbi:MAG: HNH endonuclease [Lachnospiraceae bacterium]|nr:HNH endonuclease [Lachnospiraceae bacterium]
MSEKRYIQRCQVCGTEYEAKRIGSKYCSSECRRSQDKENKRINYVGKREKVCIQCGCELPKYKTKFCSKRCSLIYHGAIKDHGLLKKICPICGQDFETYKSRKITCSDECSVAYHNKNKEKDRERYANRHPNYISAEERHIMSLKRKAKLDKDKALMAKNKAKERQKILAEKEKIKQANIQYWQQYNEEHVCVVCGKKYIAHHPFSKYCSKKCERKTHPKDRKRLKGKIVDKDITLIKVAKKYNNICQICGLKVEWTDKQRINGTTICGEYYPSIDHIQPLSKGGLHCWDNVWLAHRKCNSYKSDKIMY